MMVDDRPDVRGAAAGDVEAIVELLLGAGESNGYARQRGDVDARAWHRSRVATVVADPSAVALVTGDGGGAANGCLLASLGLPAPGPASVAPEPAPGPVSGTAGAQRRIGYVTDLAVANPADWWADGTALLDGARERLRALGAERVIVVVDHPDPAKRAFLWRSGLTLDAEYYGAGLT